MKSARVIGVRWLEINVPDLQSSMRFYTDVWGLTVVHRTEGAVHLRATSPEHHSLVLHQSKSKGLRRVALAAEDRATVRALWSQIAKGGGKTLGAPDRHHEVGGGFGFAFNDPEGREFLVLSDVVRHPAASRESDRPVKLSHVVLNSTDVDGATSFFTDVLGFRLSDRTAGMSFLRCNADHHSIAFAKGEAPALNHSAWEMQSWNALMFAAGRTKQAGYDIEWGVGRHGPGNNVFAYFIDPAGYAVEYTAEVQQIDERTHRPGLPADWPPRDNPDRWGFAALPSAEIRHAMHGGGQSRR